MAGGHIDPERIYREFDRAFRRQRVWMLIIVIVQLIVIVTAPPPLLRLFS